MPILRVSPQERKLIPLELQAQYELGRISKKELDEYLHGQLKHIESSPENKDYRDSLKAEYGDVKKLPDGLGDDNWDAMANAPIEDVVTKYMSASNQITDWNSQYAEARNEDKRYAFLDRLVNEPGFYENELSNIEAEAADAQLDPRASSDARGRLLALQQSKKEADKLSKTGELYDRRNKALSKQQVANEKLREQEFKIKAYEDYFERTGSYGKRTLADMGSNWESLLPLAGSIVGGAIGTAIEPGGGTALGMGIGSAALSGPIYNKAYNAALTSALRGNVPDNEAEAFATAMAGSEALIEAVAGRFGAGGSTARSIIKDALYKRFGKKFIAGAASESVEELAAGTLQEAGGAAVLAADQASPELQAIIAGQVPMKADGTVDYDAYLGQKARGAISGAAAGGTLAGGMSPLTIYQENKSVAKQIGAAKEALAQRKEQLQQLGFKGTDLANQLAQEANVLSATVGVDSADIFTAKDFVPEEVKIDEEIFAQSKKDLEESIRLRPNDPFTAGQIQGMQLVEQNKSVLDADRFKGTPDWQGQKVSPSAIPLPGDLGAFAVEAPTQSQGWSTATPQPTAEVTVGKPRVNLTERSGGFKPAEQSAPTVTKTTATTNLPLEKRRGNLVQTRDKLLQDVQKFAGTKIDPKAIDKQKTKIGAALAEAERQLNFEGAFEGLDANQQEDTLRKKALEFLSSGKKIEDITAEFDKATETTPDYRTQNIDAAGRFLTDSDESRARLAKNVGDPALVDNLVKAGKIVLVPSFEGKKAPDGTVLQDNNQAFIYNGDTIFVNAARLGDKTPRPGDKEVNKELAYAIVGHEYTHKRESSGESHPLLKQMIGDSSYAELNKIIEAYGSENVTAGKIGEIARTAIKRADEAVARGEVKSRGQEAPNYFLEELLLSYNGPLGKLRKYVDLGTAAIRDAYTKAGGSIKTVRPQDLAYIIGKDIKREAQGKAKAPIRDTSKKTPKGDKPQSKSTSNADKPKVTGFRTEKGSSYVVESDGTTTRTKAARDTPGHEGDSGKKDRTAKTVYVRSNAASLSAAGLSGLGTKGARVIIKDGKATLLTWNNQSGKWGTTPTSRDIEISDTPEIGMYPLELWNPVDDVKGYTAFSKMHAGNKITEISTPNKVQNSFAYRGSLKASKEIREGKGTIDPVYDEPVVEFSDKDANFDYKKFSDAGLTGKMGEVYDHPELYEYYPSLKDAKLNVDKDIKWNEGYYNSGTNTITISDRAFNTLNYPAEPGTSADKAKQKVLEETNSIIIHEIQHAIQNRRGFNAKGSNQAAEADLYRRSAYTRPNLTELKESRVDRAADWAYRANAGEIMARAAEYAYKGKMPDGTPVANGIEAAKIIKAQFAKTIKSPQDRKEFFEWFDKEIADTDKMVRFSTASDKPFYSALVRAVETGQGMPKKAAPTQWKQWLDGAQRRGDFKQSERDWMGIDAWLDGREITTREQLADFVRLNQVDVQETVLGARIPPNVRDLTTARNEAYQAWLDATNEFPRNNSEIDRLRDLSEEADKAYRDGTRQKSNKSDGPPKFASYQLPGGENYRELLIALPRKERTLKQVESDVAAREGWTYPLTGPQESAVVREWKEFTSESKDYHSSHFDQPNILAHVRFNERVDADGNKVLFVEEVQSDWHQAGRKHGYVRDADTAGWTTRVEEGSPIFDDGYIAYKVYGADNIYVGKQAAKSPQEAIKLVAKMTKQGAIPDAPLKKEWPLTAMKRVIRYAAENDFDKVAWTTGDQQAFRYKEALLKAVDTVYTKRNPDGSYNVLAEKDGERRLEETSVSAARVQEVFGKAGDQIITAANEADGKDTAVKAADMTVGGEGMRVFYDKMLPNELNKYVKKWDGKVGVTSISETDDGKAMFEVVLPNGKVVKSTSNRASADATARDFNGATVREAGGTSVPSLDITPKMKEAALQGQVLFSTADVIKNTIKSITNNKYVKGATVGMTPDKARIIDETSKNVTKLFEARMNYAIRNLQKAANNSKTPWEKIEAGWKRMIETKTLKPVTGDKNVDGALADMRIQIDSLSKQFETTFKEAGVPIPEKLKETIEANLRSYISRSFDIDYNQNYGKDYLNEVKKDPSGEKKKKLDNLIRFFQVGLVRDLQNLGTLDDERVKQIHDMLVGAGSPSIAEKRADLKAFVGSRKQSELTEALVNDVLRLNKTNKLAGFYRGSSRDTSILKTRKDVPQAIREVWGERTGVLEGAMTTIIRQARLIAETQAQADLIKRIPEDFSKTATSTLTERIDNSVDKYGPLAGMYTTPDMKNYVTERVQQYETTDSLLFDIHSVQTQDKAAADTIVGLFNHYAKVIGKLKGITVLGELINYPYNLIGMVQAAVFKGPNGTTYTDSKGNKVPIGKWGKQFVYDLIMGEVGPKTTELYQEMTKYGMLGSALTGDIQEAFVTELKQTDSKYKKLKNGFGHFFNVAFGGPELLSTGLTFVNEANFLRDLWTAQGKKFTHDDLMMEAADRTKRTTISRDRAMVFAKFGDRLGPSTYFTFFSETIRAPITNIIMANQMRKSAEGMNPEAAKLAKNYALRQFVGGVVGISLTLAIHNLLGKLMGSGFGDEPDEVAEALPEGMRVGAEGLLVLGQDNGGVKFLYNPDMANTYSALFDPIKSAIKGNFADAGKQLMDLQFVNPVVRQAYRAANGELGPSEDGFTADVNTFLSEIGLANSGFTIPIINVEPFAPQTVSRIPKLSAGVEPSAIRPLWDLAWGTKDASDFGGALGLTMTLLGARPYRYAPKKSADWSINKVSDQYQDMVANLNEVVRNRNNSKATIKAQVERFYDEEYEMLKEHYKVIKAAKAAGMTGEELKYLMKGKRLTKTITASLLSDTGIYYMTEFGGTWLDVSEMSKVLNMTPKEEALTREGYRANKEIFFEVFKEKFGTKEK